MGKISDALERQQNEKAIKSKMLQPISSPAPETLIGNTFSPKLVTCSAPGSIEAENFKFLKGQILFNKKGPPPRTIMITSALPGEGKSFIAANLAACFAQGINEYALAIDCDFRSPSLHKMFGYSNLEGLQEYLKGRKILPDLLIQTKVDKLSLLTAGSSASNASELISSAMVKELFEELKTRYHDRYIIIDTAPSHVMAEVNILANYVDGVIFVVMAGKAPRDIIHKCIENIGKEKILGIVFNGYDKPNKTYARYYKKYYNEKDNPGVGW